MKTKRFGKGVVISIFCIIGTIVCISAQKTFMNKSSDNIVNDSPYNDSLPENVRTAILSADSLTWILVDPWIDNDSAANLFGERFGEILSSVTIETSSLNEEVKGMIVSSNSFQNDSIVKESTFMPDFGIIFINSSDTVIVSYSLYCDVCRFQTSESILDLNGENIRKSFILNLKKVFPKDKFVRNISKRL